MQKNQSNIILRITALWAFSEAFLGGILHGFKMPFAGLFLAFFASLCITLIAVGNKKRGLIINATLAVIAVKFILSPQTPPMAYFAVLVQGVAGELFFIRRKNYRLAAFGATLFSLVYSALQQLITLTLIFGKQFWGAMDTFLNGITKNFVSGHTPYTMLIVSFYLSSYLIVGIVGGIMNSRIVSSIETGEWYNNLLVDMSSNILKSDKSQAVIPQKKSKPNLLFFISALLFLVLILSYLPFFQQLFIHNKVAPIALRGLCIMLTWNFFVAPLLIKLVGNWVEKYQAKNSGKIQQIILLIPEMRNIIQLSWQLAKSSSKISRLKTFIVNTVILTFYYNDQRNYSNG